ncbi:MAG: hypothetical protein HQP61_03880 [Peptococcaceae bacterium]|nr:hypothetical protein [Candidatus Syntrophopropionicum ammoniitolerans]
MLKRFLGMFFSWETVYITSNLQNFATIRGRLLDSGIRMKTKASGGGAVGRGSYHSGMPVQSHSSTTYEILVSKEDLHRATEAIHRLRETKQH